MSSFWINLKEAATNGLAEVSKNLDPKAGYAKEYEASCSRLEQELLVS